jgi:hypothetical protein
MKKLLILLVALMVGAVSAQDESNDNYQAGVKLLRDGNATAAVTLLEAALEKNPNSPRIQYAIGAANERLGKKDVAASHYRQAVSINRAKGKEPEEATLALKRLYALDPDAVFLLTQADELVASAKDKGEKARAAMRVAADGIVTVALGQSDVSVPGPATGEAQPDAPKDQQQEEAGVRWDEKQGGETGNHGGFRNGFDIELLTARPKGMRVHALVAAANRTPNPADSYGEVSLTGPKLLDNSGVKTVVAKWSPNSVPRSSSAKDAPDEKFQEVGIDIPNQLPVGDYSLTFKWAQGKHGLFIKRIWFEEQDNPYRHAVEGRWFYTTPKATYYREFKDGVLRKFTEAGFTNPTAVFTYKVLDDKTVLVDDGEKCTLLGADSLDYGGNARGTRMKDKVVLLEKVTGELEHK